MAARTPPPDFPADSAQARLAVDRRLGGAIWAFFWAVNHGQFEDVDRGEQAAMQDDVPPQD